ncbi:hypothetical protein [Deinococcus sp. QL22]|uniref:hypothetical protein n=1 Tax=Deinococcus sp. QL22 TaxID=2939437 RepID=UPI0020175895|nr:hypothetical protein [Deinococcus sp. QL22]UQN09457.1 hypothetical protein M1R55_23160 [Deinococcus sp. QL22]
MTQPAEHRPAPTEAHMISDVIPRLSGGLIPERCTVISFDRSHRLRLIEDALRLKIPLPLLEQAGDPEGQAVFVFEAGETIQMDARTSLATLSDMTADDRTRERDVFFEAATAWPAQRFTVTSGAGCGYGYFGLDLSRGELIKHLIRVYSDLDFTCLAPTTLLNKMRIEKQDVREGTRT